MSVGIKHMANKVGRPKNKPKGIHELREQAQAGIRRTQARRVGRENLDVKEFCEKIDGITHRNKFTTSEINELRDTVDLLYHEFVISKWEDEAEKNVDLLPCLQALANDGALETDTQQMTPEEWNELHGLRKNGKGLKPGPSKRKPKSVFDVELVPGEPIDFEELETQWMEEQILKKKNEPQQLKGKRMRGDAAKISTRDSSHQSFWY